jgi:very-short-patch-repair endonuclease
VGHAQLVAAGVPARTIKRWASRGLLHRIHRGVYVLGHTELAFGARERAALLASGPGAVISHASAAFQWGLCEAPPPVVDVTITGRQRRSKPGIRLHRTRAISPREIRQRHGLAVTSPARTVIDLAAAATLDELDRLVAESRVKRLIRPGELEAALARAGRTVGAARMRRFLAGEVEPDFTRSKGERRLLDLLRQSRLPQPRSNRRAAGYEVDFLWEAEKLVVEFDGYRFHGHRRAFERDRRKDVELANAGYQVLRFTWRQLTEEPLVVIAAIARALGRRGLVAA